MCTIIKVIAECFTVENVQEELKKLQTPIGVHPWGYSETSDNKLIVEISEINNHCLCTLDDHERVALLKFIEELSSHTPLPSLEVTKIQPEWWEDN